MRKSYEAFLQGPFLGRFDANIKFPQNPCSPQNLSFLKFLKNSGFCRFFLPKNATVVEPVAP